MWAADERNRKLFPEIFDQTHEDPKLRVRRKPMELLVLGMSRTGTMSMSAALQKLGYDGIYHMTSIIKNPPDAWMWIEALKAEAGQREKFTRTEWDSLLGNVRVVLDMPAVGVFPALIAAYPEAKVVVCERDVEDWYRSMAATVLLGRKHALHMPLWLLDTDFYRPFVSMQMYMARVVFGPKGLEEENAKFVYKRIYANVRDLVPENGRLEFRLQDGWEPLCQFLGKEIPDEPFPRINEGRLWNERAKLMRWLAVKRIARKSLLPMACILALMVALWLDIFRGNAWLRSFPLRSF